MKYFTLEECFKKNGSRFPFTVYFNSYDCPFRLISWNYNSSLLIKEIKITFISKELITDNTYEWIPELAIHMFNDRGHINAAKHPFYRSNQKIIKQVNLP